MARDTRPKRAKSAGIASLAAVARHWRVSPATAKEILHARGVQDTGLRKRPTFRRTDIWRIEGAPDVPEALWDKYWEPLLTPADLAERMPDKDPRTIRRDLAAQRWPGDAPPQPRARLATRLPQAPRIALHVAGSHREGECRDPETSGAVVPVSTIW